MHNPKREMKRRRRRAKKASRSGDPSTTWTKAEIGSLVCLELAHGAPYLTRDWVSFQGSDFGSLATNLNRPSLRLRDGRQPA